MTNSKNCGVCQCSFDDSSCYHRTGTGTRLDPFVYSPTFDDSPNQLLECGPAGLAGFAPPWLIDPPCVHTYSTVEQTIPFDAHQILFFNANRYDTDSMHDTMDQSSRLTFNTAGVYLVTLNIRWQRKARDTGDLAGFIRKNGSEIMAVDSMPIGRDDTFQAHSLSITDEFGAGEYVEAMAFQDAVFEDVGRPLHITVARMSPIFAAAFLRLPT